MDFPLVLPLTLKANALPANNRITQDIHPATKAFILKCSCVAHFNCMRVDYQSPAQPILCNSVFLQTVCKYGILTNWQSNM